MNDIAWPVWTLEMTPSDSSPESYPLAVGVACWTSADADVLTWSATIDPTGVDGWNSPSEVFLEHAGLTAADLRRGRSPAEVAETLNDIFMKAVVYGRSGTVDVHLANRLNLAARIWPTYSLSSWRTVCERSPHLGSSAWDIIRRNDGDAAAKAYGTMMAIAHILGHAPSCRNVPTMAVSLPF